MEWGILQPRKNWNISSKAQELYQCHGKWEWWRTWTGADAYPHPVVMEESWGIHFELMSADDDPSSFHKRKRLCW